MPAQPIDSTSGPPLRGIVVVSVEQAISAPFASRQLADLGATVIKIERPEVGDFARSYDSNVGGQSAFFVWANRSKQSVALDTRDQRHRFDALLAGADVYLHNMSPDAARRAGLDAATIRASHPAIIAAEVSGYGQGGPQSADKAYDLAIQAEAGVFDATGDGETRAKVGLSIADIAAGMYALTGILAALVRRERTGHGATVSVAMIDAMTEWMSAPLLAANALGRSPARTARRHAQIAPYGTFLLNDGTEILLAIQSNAEFVRLCDIVLGGAISASDDRFATNADRIAHVDVLESLIQEVLDATESDVISGRIQRADLAVAVVRTLNGVWQHPQLRERGRFMSTALPGGARVETLRFPVDMDGLTPPTAQVPALNEHSAGIEDLLRSADDGATRAHLDPFRSASVAPTPDSSATHGRD